jgi:hypothetical protein
MVPSNGPLARRCWGRHRLAEALAVYDTADRKLSQSQRVTRGRSCTFSPR